MPSTATAMPLLATSVIRNTPASGAYSRDGTPSKQWKLSKARPDELIEALQSDNLHWRLHASRLLVERGNKDVAPQLRAMLGQKPDAAGIAGAAHAALYVLRQLDAGNVEPFLMQLSHPAPGVRRAAISLVPVYPWYANLLWDSVPAPGSVVRTRW